MSKPMTKEEIENFFKKHEPAFQDKMEKAYKDYLITGKLPSVEDEEETKELDITSSEFLRKT